MIQTRTWSAKNKNGFGFGELCRPPPVLDVYCQCQGESAAVLASGAAAAKHIPGVRIGTTGFRRGMVVFPWHDRMLECRFLMFSTVRVERKGVPAFGSTEEVTLSITRCSLSCPITVNPSHPFVCVHVCVFVRVCASVGACFVDTGSTLTPAGLLFSRSCASLCLCRRPSVASSLATGGRVPSLNMR